MNQYATDYTLAVLENEGVKFVFLVPGGYIDPFLSAFARNRAVTPIITTHEGAATYMADGYARASGIFGVTLCISGPGVTNTVTGIATAYADRSPLLLLSGEVPTAWEGRGTFQDSSAAGVQDAAILAPVTAMQLNVSNIQVFEHHLDRLLRRMLSHASRAPVQLSIPLDIQNIPTEFRAIKKLPAVLYRPEFVDLEACNKVWDYLKDHKKIMILAGNGVTVSGASTELLCFAERYQIPVATTFAAKGVFPEDHPLSLGVTGWFGTRYANETIISDTVEVLIVLGSRLNQINTLIWNEKFLPKKALILNDINTNSVFRNFPIDLPVVGDCKAFLKTLNAVTGEITSTVKNNNADREAWLNAIKAKGTRHYHPENCLSNASPLHPARAIHALREVMPRDTIMVVDSGAHAFFAGHYWETYQPNEFFSSLNYMGPMGWGICAGIGVKFARPDAPVVIVTGDGCMLMNGMEIQTAARYGLKVIVVVMNNSALGNPYLRAKKTGDFEASLTELPTHDWAGFAQSLGATGLTVDKAEDLNTVFTAALTAEKTVVIDVRCGHYPTPTAVFDESMRAATTGQRGGI